MRFTAANSDGSMAAAMTPKMSAWIDRWPLAVSAFAALIVVWAAIPDPKEPVPESSELIGRWLRNDKSKVLEITSVYEDGSVKVGYFNPDPIRVEQASFERTEDALSLEVVLRDEEKGYNGSVYELRFNPATDELEGTYFEATQKQTIPFTFARQPATEEKP